MSEMRDSRFRELTEAYGGDLAKWPERERESARRLLGTSPMLQSVLDDAAFLDQALSNFMNVELPEPQMKSSEEIIETTTGLTLRGLINALWPFGGLWQPATGLAVASLAGFLIGVNLTDLGTTTTTSASPIFDSQLKMVETALGADALETE